jgi:Flp pilus assembly protein TadG
MHRLARRALRQRHTERGAVLVEAAFIFPVVALLTFGVIELGLGIRTADDTDGAARAGARTASQLTRNDQLTTQAATAASAGLKRLSSATPTELRIYKANGDTGAPAPGVACTALKTDCAVFTWDANTKTFTAAEGTWPAARQNNGDYVAVEVTVEHSTITGLVRDMTITRRQMYKLEPYTG